MIHSGVLPFFLVLDRTLASSVDCYLAITGDRQQEKTDEDKMKNYHRIERCYGNYERSFRLPEEVEADKVEVLRRKHLCRRRVLCRQENIVDAATAGVKYELADQRFIRVP